MARKLEPPNKIGRDKKCSDQFQNENQYLVKHVCRAVAAFKTRVSGARGNLKENHCSTKLKQCNVHASGLFAYQSLRRRIVKILTEDFSKSERQRVTTVVTSFLQELASTAASALAQSSAGNPIISNFAKQAEICVGAGGGHVFKSDDILTSSQIES